MNFLDSTTSIIDFLTKIIALAILIIGLINNNKQNKKRKSSKKKENTIYKILNLINFFLWCAGITILLVYKNFEISIFLFISALILLIYNLVRDSIPISKIDIVILVIWSSAISLLISLYVMTEILITIRPFLK